jgi:hypothetical protein
LVPITTDETANRDQGHAAERAPTTALHHAQDADVLRSDDAPGWEVPIPFDDFEVPIFPVDTLPPWMASWCEAEATALQVPIDLPAVLALSTVSLSISKHIAVEIKPGWQEPTNIYVAVGLGPGEGKSPAFKDATAPVCDWEAAERSRLAPLIAAAEERFCTKSVRGSFAGKSRARA